MRCAPASRPLCGGIAPSQRECGSMFATRGTSPAQAYVSSPRSGMAAWARTAGSRAPLLLLALPLLGLARLLPAHGAGLWLRLVAATLALLLPGSLVARALRLRGASATVVFALAALGPGLLLVFLVHSSIWLALIVLAVVSVVALPFALRFVSGPPA